MLTTHPNQTIITNAPLVRTSNALYPSRSLSLYRGVQAVWYVLGLLEIVLAFRFLLRLFAANPDAPFTAFMYAFSGPFVYPFQSVFPALGSQGYVFEWTTLLAMAVYWLLAWGVIKLFAMSRPVSRTEARSALRTHDAL